MDPDRRQLWIAISDLWLDTELSDARLKQIASVVRELGLTRDELEEVFALELAPFLGVSNLTVAGEWAVFDGDWVCEQAAARQDKRRFVDRFLAFLGITTYAARPSWRRVLELAFDASTS